MVTSGASELKKYDAQVNLATRSSKQEAPWDRKFHKFNYLAIYGTTMGETVDAKSQLADELKQHCLQKAQNLNREIVAPRDFD